jgi:hypothetical protein
MQEGLEIEPVSSEPSGRSVGDLYLDDGTNTDSGNPGWRYLVSTGPDVWADASSSSPGAESNIWTPPSSASSDDDEFDGASIDGDWAVRNDTDGAAGSFGLNQIDAYDTSFNSGNVLRAVINGSYRPSWLLVQPPNTKTFWVHKSYSPGTNALVVARMKFNQYSGALDSNDRTVGFRLTQDTGGLPDADNSVEITLNESDSTTQAQKIKYVLGSGSDIVNSDDVVAQGQPLEYIALHKLNTTYHGWVGTSSGNWIWLGTTNFTGTIAHVSLLFSSQQASKPGVGIFGIDFIRFYSTDNFLL